VADSFGLEFHVDGFWTAVVGAIVISIVSMVVESLLPDAS
jgi:putative membrane protein